jgi:sugar lactone lactonase YvrE
MMQVTAVRYGVFLTCLVVFVLEFPVRAAETAAPLRGSRLLVTLPDACPTPDAMTIDAEGNLVVTCPNFADPKQPPCLIKVTPELKVVHWFDMPVHPKTGRAAPMGIAFGPDGDLYVVDNQNWATGNGEHGEINEGRLLRLRVRNGKVERLTVVADSISHPNGIRIRGDHVYLTVSLLPKVRREDGLLTSGVYRFRLDDEGIVLRNTLEDENLLATFVTRNRDVQYGADGLAFDSRGNLFVGNFGDGALHKITFDAQGNVTGNVVFAKTDFDVPMSDPDFAEKMVRAKMRSVDGIWIDEADNVYVADFSNNAVCIVNPKGEITVLAQNPDSDGARGELNQPAEPIIWRGKLVVTNFNLVTGPDKVNKGHTRPFTISYIPLSE